MLKHSYLTAAAVHKKVDGRWTAQPFADMDGGGDFRVTFRMLSQRREFYLHVPKGYSGQKINIVLAADGITICNRRGNMAGINRTDVASETWGYVACYLTPLARYGGLLAGWNLPGGPLKFRDYYDDRVYGGAVLNILSELFAVERFYGIGFSAGVQYIVALACSLKGQQFAGIGGMAGTWLGTEGTVPPGVRARFIHGTEDTTLPFAGGCDLAQKKMRILFACGHTELTQSRPFMLPLMFARANVLPDEFTITENNETYKRMTYGPLDDRGYAMVEQFLIKPPYGGHSFHGREFESDTKSTTAAGQRLSVPGLVTGTRTESVISRSHGVPAPEEVFSCHQRWSEFFGFTEV